MKKPKTFDDLLVLVKTYLPTRAQKKIERAYQCASKAHEGQVRKSQEPYIIHPIEVAIILAELQQDTATICAAILHDTIEDTGVTKQDIVAHFGSDVYTLVEGVTKLGKIYFGSDEEAQAENLRKMFLAMAKDLRVVLIKLADRLHNMRSLKYLSHPKQLEIARETRDIFSPLAHRLGMWSLKWELEDLAFYYLQPEEFQLIKKLVASRREEREIYVESFLTIVREAVSDVGLNAEVNGRPKHFYSIYNKLKTQSLDYNELYDVLGIRILLDSIKECYEVLGVIHATFKPITGRFKDYIAMPKSNMYQSLHTAVIGPKGRPVEIQIRTREMHQIAEYGIASHWRYKEGTVHTKFDGDFSWLRQIIDTQQEKTEPKIYLQNLKVDLFMDEVFVFTPKGGVQVLPRGATPIDFAYKIHTEIGHCCVGAKANGHIVPIDYELQNGDQVEILSSKKQNPKIDWLTIAKTGHAKSKIKYWFRRQNSVENIQKGKTELEKAMLIFGYLPKDILTPDNISSLLKKYSINKLDELYLMVAQGEVSTKTIVRLLDEAYKKLSGQPEDIITLPPVSSQKFKKTPKHGIRVLGQENILINLAKCCKPLPGDDIIGFITLGYGVSVHRLDCKNILNLPAEDRGRLVDVEWDHTTPDRLYPVTLYIEAFDRFGLLKDIVSRISETKTNIREVKTKTLRKGGNMRAQIIVDIRDVTHLNQLKKSIGNVSDIYSISRD